MLSVGYVSYTKYMGIRISITFKVHLFLSLAKLSFLSAEALISSPYSNVLSDRAWHDLWDLDKERNTHTQLFSNQQVDNPNPLFLLHFSPSLSCGTSTAFFLGRGRAQAVSYSLEHLALQSGGRSPRCQSRYLHWITRARPSSILYGKTQRQQQQQHQNRIRGISRIHTSSFVYEFIKKT